MDKFRNTTEYKELLAKILGTFKEYAKERLSMSVNFKYLVARTILGSPAYDRYGRGNKTFIETLASDMKLEIGKFSTTAIYDAILLYQAEPNPQKIIELGGFNRGLQVYLGRKTNPPAPDVECIRCPKHCGRFDGQRKPKALAPLQENGKKRCFSCKKWKEVKEFGQFLRSRDKLSSYCRTCANQKAKERRQ